MLISVNEFAQGGISKPRNEIIMKFFRLLGESERQGFGGPQIFRTAISNKSRIPEIHTNLESTELKLWYIDLADSYPELNYDEKLVFESIVKSPGPISRRKIEETIGFNEYKVRKSLEGLLSTNKIEMLGKGSATKYVPKIGSKEMLAQLQMLVDQIQGHFK